MDFQRKCTAEVYEAISNGVERAFPRPYCSVGGFEMEHLLLESSVRVGDLYQKSAFDSRVNNRSYPYGPRGPLELALRPADAHYGVE